MQLPSTAFAKLLLIDTCGEVPGVALSSGAAIIASRELPNRTASAAITTAFRELFQQTGWQLSDLAAVGVVSGPGSFTGVRIGMAAAKGLCEATSLPLVPVSRLAVLLQAAAEPHAVAVLDAGRGDVYIRHSAPQQSAPVEALCAIDDLPAIAADCIANRRILVAEPKLADRLAALQPVLRLLTVADALPLVLAGLALPFTDLALIEANYLRDERSIYPRSAPPTATANPLP